MNTLGLILIVAGWLYQLSSVSKKNPKIQPNFLILYSLGSLILIYTNLNGGIFPTIFNILALVAALAVYMKLKK
ncbi:hypothetical protein HY025_00775 [Candidatus Daviesbacteria bacterium]|nr:hypothetical protein [Candidatus Daviesbacteria bacterium]